MVDVLPGAFASAIVAEVEPKLPKRSTLPPEDEQLCGPFGPQFIGLGPTLKPSLRQKLVPAAIGLSGGVAVFVFAIAMGRIHL